MKLLLVENYQDLSGVIFNFFENKGYSLDHACDGLQGFTLASQNHYDLIILDVILLYTDGFSLCQKLRQQGIDTPVLMLAERDIREEILEGYDMGADDYLVKPVDLEILEARTKAMLRRRKTLLQV
ncbi:response regulator transcription factor [Photobacterium sp.]|uniref:response regulator transcription factor n=1 Tax=Photobacterium sp. TaxID=660 RepID=UPI00299D6289|nr:response regulator [Photobacterium sp.]MDX1300874.1 response regulator [Photobacterium sp.]